MSSTVEYTTEVDSTDALSFVAASPQESPLESAVPSVEGEDVDEKGSDEKSTEHSSGIDWDHVAEAVILDGSCTWAQRIIAEAVANGSLVRDSEEWKAHSSLIALIDARCKRAKEVCESMTTHRGWTTQYEDWDIDPYKQGCEHVGVYYKKEKGTEVHSIKVRFLAHCQLLSFLAVVNEFDLLQDFIQIPGMKMYTEWVEEISNVNKILWSGIELWWPMHSRDMVCHADAIDTLQDFDGVLIVGESLPLGAYDKGHHSQHPTASGGDSKTSTSATAKTKTTTATKRDAVYVPRKRGKTKAKAKTSTIKTDTEFKSDDNIFDEQNADDGEYKPLQGVRTEEHKKEVMDRVMNAFLEARRLGNEHQMLHWDTGVHLEPKTIRLDVERGYGLLKPLLDMKKLRKAAEASLDLDSADASSGDVVGDSGDADDEDHEFGIDLVEVVAVFNVDFRSYLPKKLVNWITRTFAYYATKQVVAACEDLSKSEVHQIRLRTRDCYKIFGEKLEMWKQFKLEQMRQQITAERESGVKPATFREPVLATASGLLRAAD